MAGIYLHIPFCKQACYYCDFHFSTNQSYRGELCEAIRQEIHLQQNFFPPSTTIQTVYFGGGTPSLLTFEEMNGIMESLHQHFQIANNAEITFEANPDDLTIEKLNELKQLGINRLSIGIQSFDDDVLRFLNRAHHAQAAITCVEEARKAGFKNISIDLIYAIPSQTDDQWQSNIEKALALDPEHISSYSLTIEEKTVFGRWKSRGKLKAIDDEIAARQLELLVTKLHAAGYDQYEVSNFGKPQYYSQHNSSYWQGQHYLGLGPSAHSYNGVVRQFNIANNHNYLKSIREGTVPYDVEVLTKENKINDYLLTTLRTSWGANLQWMMDAFGYDLMAEQNHYIQHLLQHQLATLENQTLILTPRGKLLADKISSDLFVV